MIQQTVTQWMIRPAPTATLIWAEPPANEPLRTARHEFGLAGDEDDFEQALAEYRNAPRPDTPTWQVEAQDFERLYGWFLA